jgi:hypothetical protein
VRDLAADGGGFRLDGDARLVTLVAEEGVAAEEHEIGRAQQFGVVEVEVVVAVVAPDGYNSGVSQGGVGAIGSSRIASVSMSSPHASSGDPDGCLITTFGHDGLRDTIRDLLAIRRL